MASLLTLTQAQPTRTLQPGETLISVGEPTGELYVLEQGRLVNMSAPDDFRARVSHWIADIPFKGPDPRTVPGLLEQQRLDGLQHYVVLDQGEDFEEFLRAAGARSMQSMPVSLDRAVNGFLAKNHAAPARGGVR